MGVFEVKPSLQSLISQRREESSTMRKGGIELALELIDGFDAKGLSDDEKEEGLADWLRDQGCAVWQH